MIHNQKNESSFNVVGIVARTSNKEAIENGTIANLWAQFFTKNISSLINNKINLSLKTL